MGIKPGKRDYKSIILITGQELESLQEITYMMSECFGLDDRIMKYKGMKPIGLYSWDLECLEMAVEEGIKDLEKTAGNPSTGELTCNRSDLYWPE